MEENMYSWCNTLSLVFDMSTTCAGGNIWFEDSNEVWLLKEWLMIGNL